MSLVDIRVPNIGDFTEVAVIELLAKPGDTIAVDQSLMTVESDKASMEIPSSHAGVLRELIVKIGDKVSEGNLIARVEEAGQAASGVAAAAPPAPSAPAAPSSNPSDTRSEQKQPVASVVSTSIATQSVASLVADDGVGADLSCDLLVLGGGPGGYSAAFRAADLGLKVVLVERYEMCIRDRCCPCPGWAVNRPVGAGHAPR